MRLSITCWIGWVRDVIMTVCDRCGDEVDDDLIQGDGQTFCERCRNSWDYWWRDKE